MNRSDIIALLMRVHGKLEMLSKTEKASLFAFIDKQIGRAVDHLASR